MTTLIALFFFKATSAQNEECAFTLREAEKLYQQGAIGNIPTMLSPCIQEGFTKEERLQAYKLIIMTYLFNDDIRKSDSSMQAFLKKYPDYELSPTDNKKFSMLYNSYRTDPIFSFGFLGGINFTTEQVIKHNSATDLNRSVPEYSSVVGYQIGLRLKYDVNDKLNIFADFHMLQNEYSRNHEYDDFDGSYFILENLTEKSTNLYLPVSVNHQFKPWAGLFTPSIRAGFGVSYRLLTEASASRIYSSDNTEESDDPGFHTLYDPYNVWAHAGGLVSFEFLRGNIILDISYHQALMAPLKDSYSQETGNQTSILPDLLKQGTFQFSIGYIYSVYKPKKIK